MSFWEGARLVGIREFTERIRQRSFLISAGVTMLIVAAAALLPSVLGGDDTDTYTVGVIDAPTANVANAAASTAKGLDAEVKIERVSDVRTAERRARDGDLDAALLSPTRAVGERDLPDKLQQALTIGARQVATAAALRANGLDAAETRAALDPPPLRARPLKGSDDDRDQRKFIAFAAALLLYTQLLTYGIWVAMGVVEEKASRVVEILLGTLSPRSLMAGKIVGIGLLGMIQLLLTVAVALVLALATGSLSLSGGDVLPVLVVLLWFPLGYALYASLYAAAGALVSRQEDVQSATTPLTILILVSFFISLSANNDPGGGLATVVSLIPFSAPITMPSRMVLGDASVVEVVVAIALMVATTVVLVRLGARVYAGGLLRTGKPIKLADALRAAARS